ncbi:MAG: SDR family oxidoreductase [Bacteroidota bacterium]
MKGRSIVIIGGTSGMGLAVALACADQGARLVVLGKAHEEMNQLPTSIPILLADAREEGSANKAIETCLREFGSFDGLCHIAGGSGRRMGDGPLHELSLEGWNYTMTLNLTSMMLSNQAAIRTFLANNTPGAILNMSSVLSHHPSPRYFSTHAYATSKAAINGMTRALAAHYAPNNIRVNAIAPGLIETPMSKRAATNEEIMAFVKKKQPLDGGRIGQPADLTRLMCFLLSDESSFITGQLIHADGGWSVSEGIAR